MRYENIKRATFIKRINRFVAEIEIENKIERCHVKNTGRCEELFIPGVTAFVQDHTNNMGQRKLKFSLTAIKKCDSIINVDSQIPNRVIEEGLENEKLRLPDMDKIVFIKRESTYSNSRFDFYVEDCYGNCGYIEVKGVTLDIDGIAYFPDAPTERGVKHLRELSKAVEDGYKAFVIFLIQMKGPKQFQPNIEKQPEFAKALIDAVSNGVNVLAYDSLVTETSIELDKPVKIFF